jgi:hypothetical protein
MYQPLLNRIQSGNNGYAITNLPSWYFGVATTLHLRSTAAKRIAETIRAPKYTSLNAGHFALDLKAQEIVMLTQRFLDKQQIK